MVATSSFESCLLYMFWISLYKSSMDFRLPLMPFLTSEPKTNSMWVRGLQPKYRLYTWIACGVTLFSIVMLVMLSARLQVGILSLWSWLVVIVLCSELLVFVVHNKLSILVNKVSYHSESESVSVFGLLQGGRFRVSIGRERSALIVYRFLSAVVASLWLSSWPKISIPRNSKFIALLLPLMDSLITTPWIMSIYIRLARIQLSERLRSVSRHIEFEQNVMETFFDWWFVLCFHRFLCFASEVISCHKTTLFHPLCGLRFLVAWLQMIYFDCFGAKVHIKTAESNSRTATDAVFRTVKKTMKKKRWKQLEKRLSDMF